MERKRRWSRVDNHPVGLVVHSLEDLVPEHSCFPADLALGNCLAAPAQEDFGSVECKFAENIIIYALSIFC